MSETTSLDWMEDYFEDLGQLYQTLEISDNGDKWVIAGRLLYAKNSKQKDLTEQVKIGKWQIQKHFQADL